MEALEVLYPRVSPGGFVIADDYGDIPQCQRATDEYRAAHGITTKIEHSDWTGIWWRKE
jgi:O-methyltransferase